jgi:hypothetical protein
MLMDPETEAEGFTRLTYEIAEGQMAFPDSSTSSIGRRVSLFLGVGWRATAQAAAGPRSSAT